MILEPGDGFSICDVHTPSAVRPWAARIVALASSSDVWYHQLLQYTGVWGDVNIVHCCKLHFGCKVYLNVLTTKKTTSFNCTLHCVVLSHQIMDTGLYQTPMLPPIRILWLYTDWWSGGGATSCKDIKYSITGCLCPPVETAFCIGTLWDLIKKICSSGFWCQGNDSQGNIRETNKDKYILHIFVITAWWLWVCAATCCMDWRPTSVVVFVHLWQGQKFSGE